MLYSGKKIRALCDKKNKYSNSCVVRKKNSERKQKTITPRLQVKWSVPYINTSFWIVPICHNRGLVYGV